MLLSLLAHAVLLGLFVSICASILRVHFCLKERYSFTDHSALLGTLLMCNHLVEPDHLLDFAESAGAGCK